MLHQQAERVCTIANRERSVKIKLRNTTVHLSIDYYGSGGMCIAVQVGDLIVAPACPNKAVAFLMVIDEEKLFQPGVNTVLAGYTNRAESREIETKRNKVKKG
jgi:hypothetical protein